MKKLLILFTLFFGSYLAYAQQDNTDYIDPTIGNVSQLLVPTYPTAHLPNQMLRVHPEKGDYLTDQINFYPLQIVKHRSAGEFRMKVFTGQPTFDSGNRKMAIDHDLAEIKPWLFSHYHIDDNLRVSFAPASRSGIYQFEPHSNSEMHWVIQGSRELSIEKTRKGEIHLHDKLYNTTRGTDPVTRVLPLYVYMQIVNVEGKIIKDLSLSIEKGEIVLSTNSPVSKVQMKYAVSYVSQEQARDNFLREVQTQNLDELAMAGQKMWQQTVGQIQVEGGTEGQRRTFYTSLYRTYERMVDVNEYGQFYSGYDGKVHQSERPFYVDDWIWDTYLAQHPLRTILNPEMENDMLHSYVQMYLQSGWMPTFPQVYGNHMCMTAYHSSGIFIDAYRKGLKDYDVGSAYEGIKKNLLEGSYIPWRQGTPRRPVDDFYHEHGYFPSLKIGQKETDPMMDRFEKRQPVPVSLGINYDYWAMTELAREIGKEQEADQYAYRSTEYTQLWHPEHRMFLPKDEDGQWLNIDPKSAGGLGYREYYDENNGWTYAWDVKHDIDGLVELLGGKEAAIDRLDQLFREPMGKRKSQFYIDGSNSTGMVGQFSMGNEPSFHIPYLYNYFGAPWKTQQRTRFLLDVWFKDNLFGIPGDEDGGGMTAFVVFTSMGLYPVTPGIPVYSITSPVFERVTIDLKNGKQFTIIAEGASKKSKYIQRALINGQEIDSPFISHEQIMSGATLELELSDLPNRNWGLNGIRP
ncbi:glycoside hydrolase family 92 protein [Reichenbachiella ulvae]|uniref:Glycoside hydrolase family 92 protein n=1 Tax=Reichenbachiella ulvae TaxID=2980104 RepID=A0ABT3CNF5_9BACT|nr:glycoside hydrolase family 92 protein [Reichenbachiella ulvae]MCV9385271.1 glycoside hydrolase family 92 protein [Reichenbachiella ulvae]